MIRAILSSPVTELSHIGAKVASQLRHLGVLTAQDLLFYFPSRWDDLSRLTEIKAVRPGERVVVRGRVELIESARSKWKRKLLTQAVVGDGTGSVRVVWFNQPWVAKMFKSGDEVYLVGYAKDEGSGLYLSSPMYEKVSKRPATHAARLVPVYPSTEKLSQKQIRFLVRQALPLARSVPDPLPVAIKDRYGLTHLPQALTAIHFPPDEAKLEEARRRLKFDELLRLQLFAVSLKRELKKISAPEVEFHEAVTKKFVEGLPFQLTDDQRKAAWEILCDMSGRKELNNRTTQQLNNGSSVQFVHPMNRLLEGEVGSGKTVVVAIAALNAVLGSSVEGLASRGQVAIMAPTEILARQHFKTFSKFLEPQGITIALRIGEEKRKKQLIEADVIVGTHALIQGGVKFKNLVLAVVDEQHRFGVSQRAALKEKRGDGLMPHLLTLTATPIPRSLALVFYGDLDISVLKEMPKGRQRIETILVADHPSPPPSPTRGEGVKTNPPPLVGGVRGGGQGEDAVWSREQAHDFVRGQVAAGHQVFWTCPIIDPSDTLGVKAATEVFEHLKNDIFPDLHVGLLHGRMKSKEREKVMEEFASVIPSASEGSRDSRGGRDSSPPAQNDKMSRIDILVATPVIEVGIDVPNATVMVIEGVQNFGLAQLHQFRGRVGRGEAQSYCLLMVDDLPPPRTPPRAGGEISSPFSAQGGSASGGEGEVRRGPARLKAFLECDNGFELAERDLALRGPGEIYSGTAQSGFPEFKIASFADVEIAKAAKAAAQELLAQDPELRSYPQLRAEIMQKEGKAHLE
ncbi:ATP-dependent DNA helicase RecG [Candidatus Uhrbacteria bacterium]|nr:ATP-dependent DNA helicase RecG [Candidatus Uhrbacteria bacterium]